MNLENYCISCRHILFGQTTKQPLNRFKPQKAWKYKQPLGLMPDSSCLQKNNSNITDLWGKILNEKVLVKVYVG